ncbi:MAG: hypothetical protein ACOX6N_04775, partial [Patescibacteria group bacterium]
PLFHDTNISPGYSASQTLTIVNNRPEVCFLGVQLENNQTDISPLSDVIQINIGDISHTLRFLLMSDQDLNLGSIPSGTSKPIVWQAVFDPVAGNEYQGLSQYFNIDLNFTCSDVPPQVKTLTLISAPASAIVDESFIISFTLQNALPNTLYYIKAMGGPGGSDNNFQTFYNGSWLNYNGAWLSHPSFTTDSFGNISGTISARGKNANGTNNLNLRANHRVGDVNNTFDSNIHVIDIDAPPKNNEESTTTTTGSVGGGDNPPAPTATPTAAPVSLLQQVVNTAGDILGVSTKSSDEPELYGLDNDDNQYMLTGDVAGTSVCSRYWIPLFFILTFLFNFFYFFKSKSPNLIIPILASATFYAADRLLLWSSCCRPGLLCQYLIHTHITALIVAFLSAKAYTRIRQ